MTTVSNIGPSAALPPLPGPVDDGPGSIDGGHFDRLLRQDFEDRHSDKAVIGPAAADRPSPDDTPLSRPPDGGADNAPASVPANDSQSDAPAGDTVAATDDLTSDNDKAAVGGEARGSDESAADKMQPDIAGPDNSPADDTSQQGLAGEALVSVATPLPAVTATDIKIALQPQAVETPVPANAVSTPIPDGTQAGDSASETVPSGEVGRIISSAGNPVAATTPATVSQAASAPVEPPVGHPVASDSGQQTVLSPTAPQAASSEPSTPRAAVEQPVVAAPVADKIPTTATATGDQPTDILAVLSEDEAQALPLISRAGTKPAGGSNANTKNAGHVISTQAAGAVVGGAPGTPATVGVLDVTPTHEATVAVPKTVAANGLAVDNGIETAKPASPAISPTAGPAPVSAASFIPDPSLAASADIRLQSAPTLASAIATHPQAVAPRVPLMTNIPLNQVAVQIARAFDQGTHKFSMRLHPAELGRVDVSLEVAKSGRVTAVLTTDRQDTLDVLQRDVRALERSLQDSGLSTDSGSLQFSLRDDTARQGFETAFNTYRNSTGDDLEAELTAIDIPASGDRPVPSSRALDIRI